MTLKKLSADFRREAGCEFTPGTTTVRLLTLDGRITLPDKLDGVNEDGSPNPGSVSSVQRYHDGKAVEYTVVGNDVIPTRTTILGPERAGTGDMFVVTYTHNGTVPDDVNAAIALTAARYMTVDPKSAVAQSTMLSAEGYHQRMAAWVADSVKLSPSDIALAHAYRSLPAMPIVAKLGGRPSAQEFDTRWVSGSAWL